MTTHLKNKKGVITFVKAMKNNVYEYTLMDDNNHTTKFISYSRRSISHNVIFEYEQKKHSVYGEQNQLKTVTYKNMIKDANIIKTILNRIADIPIGDVNLLIGVYGANFFELLLKDPKNIYKDCDEYAIIKLKDFLQGEQPIVISSFFSVIDPEIKISNKTCGAIIERFGCDTNAIKENIYDLHLECKMKFEDVDKLALKHLKYKYNDNARLISLIKVLTKLLNKNGTVYTDINFMKKFCSDNNINPKTLVSYITYIKTDGGKYFTTRELYDMEKYIENYCHELLNKKIKINTDIKISKNLHHKQETAITNALANPISIICGGPGTGKTHIIKEIMKNTEKEDHVVMALSGAAVERIKKDIAIARTIKSYLFSLKKTESNNNFVHEVSDNIIFGLESESASQDFVPKTKSGGKILNVIIDEFSLVSMKLFKKILVSLQPRINNLRIILIGDPNQLPAIGAGNLLYDMASSKIIPCTKLTKIHRTDVESLIANAKLALDGNPLEPDGNKFVYKKITSVDQVYDILEKIITEYKLTPQNSTVLTPSATNNITVTKLNDFLQTVYNPTGHIICTNTKSEIRAGDKLMQTINDKDDNVYNGSILSISDYKYNEYIKKDNSVYKVTIANGKMISRDKVSEKLSSKRFGINITCEYNDPDLGTVRKIKYDTIYKINNLQLAYSMTIHKAQGSGYDTVVIVIHSGMGQWLLCRKMLYTAITRSIKRCIIIADIAGLKQCREVGLVRVTNLFKGYKQGRFKNN